MKRVADKMNADYQQQGPLSRSYRTPPKGRPVNWKKAMEDVQNHPFSIFPEKIKKTYFRELDRHIQNKSLPIIQEMNYKNQQRERRAYEYIIMILKEKEKIQPRDLKNFKTKFGFPNRPEWYANKISFLLNLRYDKIPFFIRYIRNKAISHAIYINPKLLLHLVNISNDENAL